MVSLNTIRDEFAKKLAIKPRGLSMEEFRNIAEMLLQSIDLKDQELFTRFDYWMRHSDRSVQIICANIELVRFGVLSARPQQKSKKSEFKNSADYSPLSFTDRKDLNKFLNNCLVEPLTIKRLPETIEIRAQLIDKWVAKQVNSKKRIDLLDLEDITEEANNGNKRTQSMEYISYEDLVRCISRSKNASSLRDYAMHLMAVFKIYSEELIIAKDNAIDEKNDKIDNLNEKVDGLKSDIRTLLTVNKDQTAKINQQDVKIDRLLQYGENTKMQLDHTTIQLDTTITKLDIVDRRLAHLSGFTTEFARMTLPMWVGSSVLKTQLAHLLTRYNLNNALQHLKIAFAIGIVDDNELKIYFCCTNFADVGARINKIYNRHIAAQMLQPRSISLVSCEINTEIAMIRSIDLPNITARDNKTFTINIGEESVDTVYNGIIAELRRKRLQPYQMRRDTIVQSGTFNLSEKVLTNITNVDNRFFESALPFSQSFLDCYVDQRATGSYGYTAPSRRTVVRADLENMRLTDRIYPLWKIRELLENDQNVHLDDDDMFGDDGLNDDNIHDLETIARSENIPIPERHEE